MAEEALAQLLGARPVKRRVGFEELASRKLVILQCVCAVSKECR